MKTYNLSEIEISKVMVKADHPHYDFEREVFIAEFQFGTKCFNAEIHPWLDIEYGDYTEGGYVTGTTCTYTWTVDMITNITFMDDETGVFGDTSVSPPIKTIWLQELSEYMTDNQLFISEN